MRVIGFSEGPSIIGERISPDWEFVDVCAQRICGEVPLPQARREFGDAAGGMFADPLQHIDEIGVGIDAVESAGDDPTLEDADVLRP